MAAMRGNVQELKKRLAALQDENDRLSVSLSSEHSQKTSSALELADWQTR